MPADKTALLVMDVQPGILGRAANPAEYLEKVKAAVSAARERGMAVVYVVVGFRPGFPESNPRNAMLKTLTAEGRTGFVNPQPALEPAEGEIVVTKRRVSAFSGSDLEVVLRAGEIRHLVLCGIATSGVVLSTVREAADKDYRLTVLEDLCIDADPEVHRVLTTKVFPRQAAVVSSSEWIASLEK